MTDKKINAMYVKAMLIGLTSLLPGGAILVLIQTDILAENKDTWLNLLIVAMVCILATTVGFFIHALIVHQRVTSQKVRRHPHE
jgi:predicted PurR-regulated permease PerM